MNKGKWQTKHFKGNVHDIITDTPFIQKDRGYVEFGLGSDLETAANVLLVLKSMNEESKPEDLKLDIPEVFFTSDTYRLDSSYFTKKG